MEADHDSEQLPSSYPPCDWNIAGGSRACRRSGRSGESAERNRSPGGRLRRWGHQDVAQLPWAKGSTVLDVMNAAKNRPHGISFEYTGSGTASFLTRIDDLANQGGGKKNWQLWVNTSYADKSFAVYEVQPLDVVFWRFTMQEGK